MLSKALQKLSEQALEAFKRYRVAGKCGLTRVPTRRAVIEHFGYDRGAVSFACESQNLERQVWALTDQYRFVHQVLKALSSFRHCAEAIARSFHIDYQYAEPRLGRYLQVLVSKYFHEQEQLNVEALGQTFLHDLAGEAVSWSISGALQGVALEGAHNTIGTYRLRQPVPGDFEVEQTIDEGAVAAVSHPLLAQPPSAFLEFETTARDHHEVRRQYERLVDLLRLFRLGSVRSVALTSKPHSVLQVGGTLYPIASERAAYAYAFTTADQAPLARFIDRTLPCLEQLDSLKRSETARPSLCLAYASYKQALLGQGPLESQAVRALAGLEALFLKPSERDQAYQRFSRRMRTLLGAYGKEPDQVSRALQEAYAIRSAERSAPAPTEAERDERAQPVQSILDWLRIALIVFLQLAEDVGRDTLIDDLESAAHTRGAGSRLTKWLQAQTEVPL